MGIYRRTTWAMIFCKKIGFGRAGVLGWALASAAMAVGPLLTDAPQAFAWHPEPGSCDVAAVVWTNWARSVYCREHVPYFALHPPVYYTQPVGRPYGWSPFAYPAWVPTPLLEPPRPMVIQNPYVVGFGFRAKASFIGDPGTGMPEPGAGAAGAPQPIRITNPYIGSGTSEGSRSASAKAPDGFPKPSNSTEEPISSTASVQPRRIRNPHLPE